MMARSKVNFEQKLPKELAKGGSQSHASSSDFLSRNTVGKRLLSFWNSSLSRSSSANSCIKSGQRIEHFIEVKPLT